MPPLLPLLLALRRDTVSTPGLLAELCHEANMGWRMSDLQTCMG